MDKWEQVPQLRPLIPRRDLKQVADLIDLCFSEHMDDDGRSYLRQIRNASENSSQIHWVPGAGERVSVPLYGYVWEEDGRIVGNLSLIPFLNGSKWIYLIANVAVHPDYRRRRIGWSLTQKALEHIEKHGARSAWLQVRDENVVAYNLYSSLGFIERTRRTNWRYYGSYYRSTPDRLENVTVQSRVPSDWAKHETWLKTVYPEEVAWYLSFDLKRFKPSRWQDLLRFISGAETDHWSVYYQGDLIGALTWEPGKGSSDILWLATDPDMEKEDLAIHSLLPHVFHSLVDRHSFMLNYPFNRGQRALQDVNFKIQNTLIWMEVNFERAGQLQTGLYR